MEAASKIHSKMLRRRSTPQEYRIYRAGLEWDLVEPIVTDRSADLRSADCWRGRLEPNSHQISNLVSFCHRLPATLIADEVGLGKRTAAGLIISELISRARISRALIVCPKLLGSWWKEELESRFDIRARIATGRDLMDADPDGPGVTIATYNSARVYLDDIPADRFQLLILDEVHVLRTLYGAERPPLVATRLRKALADRRFGFVLMLTAKPIRDRLWDIYSLVDLLAVARGHDNPFGSEDLFARRFIADGRDRARQIRSEAREDFRAIVSGYMSRLRWRDATLHRPNRTVRTVRVEPAAGELDLIMAMIKPVRRLARSAQISALQALASGPEALMAELADMTERGIATPDLTTRVAEIVASMPASAKLRGLASLIERLKTENPGRRRLVVFTGWRETRSTIQAFLESQGLAAGLTVVTDSGPGNIDLLATDSLVNYDLPWNPVVMEQRIGRMQRLASEPARLDIVNLVLQGTFEERVVGRLAATIQAAARAVDDIETLLQGSNVTEGDDDTAARFEDRTLDLVYAFLAGTDVNTETQAIERTIEEARAELEREEAMTDAMLGGIEGAGRLEPRAPRLAPVDHAMAPREFVLAAFAQLGARVTPKSTQLYLAEENSDRTYIRFERRPSEDVESIVYAPGSPAFRQLVRRIIATGVHAVEDLDGDPIRQSEDLARRWAEGFGAKPKGVKVVSARRSFDGATLMRVRAAVAHDSYERLVEVNCARGQHCGEAAASALSPLSEMIEDPAGLGIDVARLAEVAGADAATAEFCRFYLERREMETRLAAADNDKRARLADEFTPRVETTLVGIEGRLHRTVDVRVHYAFDDEPGYEDGLVLVPHSGEVIGAPGLGRCSKSNRIVPLPCLSKCDISGALVLRHLLVMSEFSQRLALPEHSALCSLSGKRALTDELETSSATGKPVASALLRTSALSGRRAEPEHFGQCAFTGAELMTDELAISEISGKPYRVDEMTRSSVSARAGHSLEFVVCHETRQPIALSEAETCALTGYRVRSGILECCAVTGDRVLPTELEACAVTGQRVLKRLLVTSSLSGLRLRKDKAVRSSVGRYCAPAEAQTCLWSGRSCHPDDLRTCSLTGLEIHFDLATVDGPPRLLPLSELLDGSLRIGNETQLWDSAANRIEVAMQRGRCQVHAAILSPARQYLAICSEVSTLLGMRTQRVGAVYDIAGNAVVGRLAVGKRGRNGWIERRA